MCILNRKHSLYILAHLIDWDVLESGFKKHYCSDNGREFAHHERIAQELGISVFFAKPYHAWERGANENLNGLYRQYIPKETDFSLLDKDTLGLAGNLLNNRPRKKLDFLSPIQEICRIFAPDNDFLNAIEQVAFIT